VATAAHDGARMEIRPRRLCDKYERLFTAAIAMSAITTAIVHPCDEVLLQSVVEAARIRLIKPILIGPAAKVRASAEKVKIDISAFPLIDAAHSHDSAARAVALVREDRVDALMTGSFHTDELIGLVVARETGIRKERRISHCFIIDMPGHRDPLIITDAAMNIAPTLEDKADIVQNAIDLAKALHFGEIRVAILSAVEAVKMAERRQIAHRANILVAPDREAGNKLAKRMSFLAGADPAGIVLGARVPIIATSPTGSLIARLASCAVASLSEAAQRHPGSRPVAIRQATRVLL
jgi:phosphate acetyltransferase